MATLIAMAIVWEFMLDARFGAVNIALKAMGLGPFDFLHDRKLVLFTLLRHRHVAERRLQHGAVHGGPDRRAVRALRGGGGRRRAAGGFERFKLVTWPMLGPVTLFTVVITAIRAFQVFDTVQVLTDGGPNKASAVLLHTIYAEAFSFFRNGYAAALVVVFLALHHGAVGDARCSCSTAAGADHERTCRLGPLCARAASPRADAGTVVMLAPFVSDGRTSFKPKAEIFAPDVPPAAAQLGRCENYRRR